MMATLVVGPFYLSRGLGLVPAIVGVVVSVGPVVAALVGTPAGVLADRLGAHRVSSSGLVVLVIGCSMLSVTPHSAGVAGYLAALVAITTGYALFQTGNNTAVMTGVRPDQKGVVSGTLNLSRSLGLLTGASVMGSLFALASGATDPTTADPEAVTRGLRVTFTAGTLLIVMALAIVRGRRWPAAGKSLEKAA
jgi:MFS family permease